MSRNNQTTGVSMSGPVYEPQVSPYDRDDDDVSVLQNRGPYRDDYDDKAYGQNDYAASQHRSSRGGDGDVWNRRDLTPTYEQAIGRDFVRAGKPGKRSQPWDNYRARRQEELTAGYGELADNFRAEGQYRQPWDDYLSRRR